MEKKYMYDAFISYRHTELDKFVAENLHKYMEAFKLPKSILKSGKASRTSIERVFRDKDELPLASNLEDPIINALINSEYLIVICSPRLKESMWCKKEIETFIQYHGREKILAVLVEGEPKESFPEELLYTEEYFYYPDGTLGVTRKSIEPLAADVRGSNKKEILKALKTELLRLLAPMFSVNYDDLKQRHRERKMKKIVAVSVSAAIICLLIGIASTIAALHIKNQKEEISSQAKEISAQAEEINNQNQILLENQAKNLAEKSLDLLDEGDRIGAIQIAGYALTEYEGITMPYTPEAKYALTESLHVYDSGNIVKAQYQLVSDGVIEFMSVAPDGKTVVTIDKNKGIYIWDIASGVLIDVLSDIDILFYERDLVYVDSDRLAYLSNDGTVHIYNISTKQIDGVIEADDVMGISSDLKGGYLAISSIGHNTIYDMTTLQALYTFDAANDQSQDYECYFSDNNIMIYTETQSGEFNEETDDDLSTEETDVVEETDKVKTKLNFVNLTNGTVYATQTIDYKYITDIDYMGQQVYVIAYDSFEGIQKVETGIFSCSLSDGTIVWKNILEDKFITGMKLPYVDDATDILVYSSLEMFLLDKTTGQEKGRFASGSGIAGTGVYTDSDRYMVFSRSGEFGLLYAKEKEFLVMEYIFDCKSQDVNTFKGASGCFLVLSSNDNKVTVYKVSANPDMTPYVGEYLPVDDIEDEEIDSGEEAEKLGLEKSALVKHIMYSPDKSVVFVSYSDSTLEIYNVSDMTLIETITGIEDEINRYLGTDNEGSIYIAGDTQGYCLDNNLKLTAKIENLLMVDVDNNQMIVGNTDNMYSIPIYTTEELLDMVPTYTEEINEQAD